MGHLVFDILFVVVGLAIIFLYAKRGFLKSLIHSMKMILAFVAAYFLGGKLAQFLCDKFISAPVRESVYGKLNTMYQNSSNSFNAEQVMKSFPDFIMNEEVKANLTAAEGSGEALVNSMADTIAKPIATVISTVIGYVLVFVIALVALWVAAAILDKLVEHISILHLANTILGGVFGLILAFILLFVAGSVLKFFLADSVTYTQSVILKFFGDSSLLDTLKFLNVGNMLG